MLLDARKTVEARRVGDNLVAAFHRAHPPLIWRFDLERHHSFTLALQGEEGEWELGITTIKGEFHPVARFIDQEDAQQAFAKLQKVLSQGKHSWAFSIFKWSFIGFGLLFAAAITFAFLIGNEVMGMLRHPDISAISAPAPSVPETKNGVPLPADQYLRPPQ